MASSLQLLQAYSNVRVYCFSLNQIKLLISEALIAVFYCYRSSQLCQLRKSVSGSFLLPDLQTIVWNAERAAPVVVLSVHSNTIHSVCWQRDGALLATSSKDKQLRVLDPRAGPGAPAYCLLSTLSSTVRVLMIYDSTAIQRLTYASRNLRHTVE